MAHYNIDVDVVVMVDCCLPLHCVAFNQKKTKNLGLVFDEFGQPTTNKITMTRQFCRSHRVMLMYGSELLKPRSTPF